MIFVTLEGITLALHPAIKAFSLVSMMALQFSRESYVSLPSATTIEVRFLQPKNEEYQLMKFTDLGITMLVIPMHPSKALRSILFTDSGMIKLFNPVQPRKA